MYLGVDRLESQKKKVGGKGGGGNKCPCLEMHGTTLVLKKAYGDKRDEGRLLEEKENVSR